MYGKGLLKGLGITLGHFFGKPITELYPEQRPNLAPRFHGFFELDEDKCIACGICANACPNKVIEVKSVRDENKKRQLTGYKMELGYCLFCGLCVESCPHDAINFTTDFELSCYTREGTTYELFTGKNKKQGEQQPSC